MTCSREKDSWRDEDEQEDEKIVKLLSKIIFYLNPIINCETNGFILRFIFK